MNQKSRYAFRIVLGGWLTYIGCSLLYQMYTERPSNMVLISLIAVIFVLIGAVCVLHSLKKVLDLRKGERPESAAEKTYMEKTQDKSEKRRNRIQSVLLTQNENEPETEEKPGDDAEQTVKEELPAEERTAESPSAEEQKVEQDSGEDQDGTEEDRTKESVSENIPEEHPKTEETTESDIAVLDISEDETDNHADEIENDYEEK